MAIEIIVQTAEIELIQSSPTVILEVPNHQDLSAYEQKFTIISKENADSPVRPSDATNYLFKCDCTDGGIVFNLTDMTPTDGQWIAFLKTAGAAENTISFSETIGGENPTIDFVGTGIKIVWDETNSEWTFLP